MYAIRSYYGDGRGDLAQRQVGGGQCYAQTFGGQHHHHLIAARLFGEEFGVAAEGDAGLVDHPLVDRSGHQGCELATQGAGGSPLKGRQHIAAVGHIQLARGGGLGKGDGFQRQGAGRLGAGLGMT